jgi:hypothetical protein
MVIFCYVLKHIITNKNKILYKLFYYYLLPTTKKLKKLSNLFLNLYRILYLSLRKYMMNLRINFYESLQAQCYKQEYKFI